MISVIESTMDSYKSQEFSNFYDFNFETKLSQLDNIILKNNLESDQENDLSEIQMDNSKEEYFLAMNKFIINMKANFITADKLNEAVIICLDILNKYRKLGKNRIYIKASNRIYKLACKFIGFYYNIKLDQECTSESYFFSCCQYRINNYMLKGILKHNTPKKCKCTLENPFKDRRIILDHISRDGIKFYKNNIDCIFFYFNL